MPGNLGQDRAESCNVITIELVRVKALVYNSRTGELEWSECVYLRFPNNWVKLEEIIGRTSVCRVLSSYWRLATMFPNEGEDMSTVGQLSAVRLWVLRIGKAHVEMASSSSMCRGCQTVEVYRQVD